MVPKGEWLQTLGLGQSASFLGNEGSICIRVPDCGALAYVVSMAGPVAITSANISGGDDSIHHTMVVDTLGEDSPQSCVVFVLFCFVCTFLSVVRGQ